MAVTFLMTDIEGSTLLWDSDPDAMSAALAEHDEIIEQTVHASGGRLVKSKGEGDATMSVFERASDAAAAAIAVQRRLFGHEWTTTEPIKVRIALDTGEAQARAGDFFGPVLNRCARLRGAGNGGQILLSHATAREFREAPVSGARLEVLGAFRLKGLKNVERVYQLTIEGIPQQFETLRALGVRLHNLPQETASPVGREREIAEILEALRSHRLVTIWGPGGAGKTHLALRVAARLVDSLPDGAWWVDFVGLADPDLVADQVARVLGVGDPKAKNEIDDICALLSERDLVLVLDNCEHLIEHAAELASALLESCSRVQIIATSRERLRLPGESVLALGGLALPDIAANLSQTTVAPAIRLFLERAREVGASIDISDASSLELVRTVCTRVEGLPLAIELAAGALTTMDLSTLGNEMKQRLDVLDASPRRGRGAAGRRTIREAIEWSTSRITAEERRALTTCSVFSGSFSLEAARMVADCDTRVLVRLVEQSLVSRDASGTRYRLLEPIREFAAQTPGDETELIDARARFLEWVVSHTQPPDPSTVEWLDLIEADLDNVRGGLNIASQSNLRALCELALNITPYWFVRGPIAEGRAWTEAALELSKPDWVDLRAHLARELGFLAYWLGDYEASSRSYEKALALARNLGDRGLEARVLTSFGLLTEALGDLPKAKKRLEQAVLRAREVGQQRTEADSLSNLGMIAWLQGDRDEAAARYQESLQIRRAIGDAHGVAISLYNLGEAAEARGENDEARGLWREAFETNISLKDEFRAAATLRAFALSHGASHPERVAMALGASEAVIQLLGMREPASTLPPELARHRDDCIRELGVERFEELEMNGASMSLDEAARYVGLLPPAAAAKTSRTFRSDKSDAGEVLHFVREGEFWTVGSASSPIRMKDTVGLRCIAYLVANPGREVAALELAGVASEASGTRVAVVREDSGEMLDDQAKRAYRKRITDLEQDLAEAREWADDARTAKLGAELDALLKELARATGLGGRDRRAGSTSERARVNVTKAIRSAIKRIGASDAALGSHLDGTIRTGTVCIYLPDPEQAPSWRL